MEGGGGRGRGREREGGEPGGGGEEVGRGDGGQGGSGRRGIRMNHGTEIRMNHGTLSMDRAASLCYSIELIEEIVALELVVRVAGGLPEAGEPHDGEGRGSRLRRLFRATEFVFVETNSPFLSFVGDSVHYYTILRDTVQDHLLATQAPSSRTAAVREESLPEMTGVQH